MANSPPTKALRSNEPSARRCRRSALGGIAERAGRDLFSIALAMIVVLGGLFGSGVGTAAPSAATSSATAGPSASAAAESPAEEASARFRRGVGLYRDGDFRAALIEFKRAYEIAPNYQVLYNLGQASAELQDYVSALQAFERYLAEGGDEIASERRAEVQAELERLRPRVARLLVKVDATGADVLVDDLLVAESPMASSVMVSAGRRKIVVTKEGHVPVQRYVDLAGGDEVTVELALASLAAAGPEGRAGAQRGARPAPAPPESSNTGLWVSLGITLALGTATGIVGGLALDAGGSYDDELATFPTTAARLDDARSRVEALALTTDVLAAATAGGALVTILFAALEGGSGGDEEPATAAARAELRPMPGGLAVGGVF